MNDIEKDIQTLAGAPDIGALLTAISAEWGGPDAMAREIKLLYDESGNSPNTRARILLAYLDLVGKHGGLDESELMTDEDLEQQIEALRDNIGSQPDEAD